MLVLEVSPCFQQKQAFLRRRIAKRSICPFKDRTCSYDVVNAYFKRSPARPDLDVLGVLNEQFIQLSNALILSLFDLEIYEGLPKNLKQGAC